jgi:GAF domain-containing protein
MGRGVRPVKAKVEAKSTVVTKSGSTGLQLEQRLAEASAQHAAISQILQVISASPGDVQPVLDAVAERAADLCQAPLARVLLVDGYNLRAMAEYSLDGTIQERTAPLPLKRTTITGRAVLDRATIHHEDVVPLLDREYPDALNAPRLGLRAVLAVPLVSEGNAYGAILLFRPEPRAFSPDQVALVETFAHQAAIAIENARLFKETKEALAQQTATSEILRVIASSPGDVQPMLEAVVERALKLCEATGANIFLADGDKLRAWARVGAVQGAVEFGEVIPLTRGSVTGRAFIDRVAIHIEDLAAEPEEEFPIGRALQRRQGHHAALSIPLMREDRAIGAIALWRMEARRFTDKQIALVNTFADQAAIAIENVRLFNETKEGLERQTATAEVLKVISESPTDVQPVFEAVAKRAGLLCRADGSRVWRVLDGELRTMTRYGRTVSGDFVESLPLRRTSVVGRAVLERRVIDIDDVVPLIPTEYPDIAELQKRYDFRTLLIVPLLREGEALGVISLVRNEVRPFTSAEIALVQTFADQAVIAIGNVRLFNETKEALEQQTATSEILGVISRSPRDVQPVFDTIAAAALKLCRAGSAIVVTFDGALLRLTASAIVNADLAEAVCSVWPRSLDRQTAAGRAILTGGVVMIPDVLEDSDFGQWGKAITGGFRSVLGVPLVRAGSPIGAIALGRAEPGYFPDKQIVLVKTFADQAVIAIENVRLFTELEARTLQLTRSVGELKALGEVGQAVSSTLDLETVLSTIVTRATGLAGMDAGAIYEYDDVRGEFYLHTADRLEDEVVTALRAGPIRKGEGALGRMAMTGEPAQIHDIMADANYQSRLREVVLRLGYRSLMAVPLMRDNHLLGGLVVYQKTPGEFDASVIDLLKTFATQSALAIQNARLFHEIEDKSRQLAIASQHKSEFLANMSHELRTPLNAIIGFSEVLSQRMFGEINDKQAEYLGDILESGRHLLSLINDILDLSKIEAGRMELEPTEFDLPTTIENTLSLVRERAQRHGITLACSVDERLGRIRGDERKVKQVLLNLLSNALKFTPESGRIDVRAAVGDGTIEISVTDTGLGIAPEDQEAVFEEFRQVGTAAKKVEGTGLGLAISRKFIELHGGKIWVNSQVGTGSSFTFTLPLQ